MRVRVRVRGEVEGEGWDERFDFFTPWGLSYTSRFGQPALRRGTESARGTNFPVRVRVRVRG